MKKQCCHCKKVKNIEEFGKLQSNPDGLRRDCKECRRKYYQKNRKRIIEKTTQYAQSHKDQITKKNKIK